MSQLDKVNARFKDAPWYYQQEIIIGGAGGIGSWVSLLLARANHSLHIFDFDMVDMSNIGGQLYRKIDVGKMKTQALYEIITAFSENNYISTYGRFEEDTEVATNIMFSCFDNMSARKMFYDTWKKNVTPSTGPVCFIDGRLEAETAIIYCIRTPAEMEAWEKEWFPDSNVPDAPCTFRATSHNAAIIAGFMVGHLNNVLTNHAYKEEIRVTPWKTVYQLPTMTFESVEI